MNTSKKNIALNNGWILCPSKTFPGKFYYFNVLNGETAWSLNEADKKSILHKDTTIADKSHDYPEPTSLPDENAIGTHVTCHIGPNFKNPNIVRTIPCPENLPTFGRAAFPNYVANTETLMPNIVWTPVQLPMPMPMFCPDTRRPMFDKVTQTSELERQLFIQTCDIPLCKRFKNYENPSLCFENNKIVNKRVYYFDTSTPKSSHVENKTQHQNHIPKSNFQIKEPILKLENELSDTKSPEMVKNNSKSTFSLGNRVEATKIDNLVPEHAQKDEGVNSLDKTDLRFLLLAKRRKSVDATEEAVVERKRPKSEDVAPKKKVTFNLSQDLSDISDDETVLIDASAQERFIPVTPEHTPANYATHTRSPILGFKETTSPPITRKTYTETPKDLPTKCRQKDTVLPMTTMNDTWYIVVDTDVLLLDKEFVDELVLSDNKCKLLVPHAVHADVAAMCVGDSRGQQRVINARHITRRLATPPPHYIVEPEPDQEEDIVVTTDSILQCCMNAVNQNHYVVLITNDPYLQAKASSLHIPNYKLNEIKNDFNIQPDMTSELSKFKICVHNDDSIKNDMLIQNKNNLGLFSNTSFADNVKKQLFLNDNKDIELDCDKLINITKPKSFKNNDSYSKCDSDIDINRKLKNLDLKERNILRSQNGNGNPFFDPTVCKNNINKNGYTKFEKIIQTSNPVFKQFDCEKTVPDSKMDIKQHISNREIHQRVSSIKDTESTENICYSDPISKIKKLFHNLPTHESYPNTNARENFDITFNNKMPKESFETAKQQSRETKILNATQSRLKKIFNNMNFDVTNNKLGNQEQIPKTNDSTEIFKVPQPVQFKNRTRKAAQDGSAAATREFQNIDSVEEILKRFSVKSKVMSQKLSSRMDEWICSFTQIMEDALNQILQNNNECMKDTVAPLTLHDTLNCIKMLYDSHTKVRDAVDNTSDLINRCIYKKDKVKPLNPDQFMKMFGYGVLLILSLEEILPQSEVLQDAGTHLSSLLASIETTAVELDPELLKTPYVSSADVDARDDDLRPNFSKEPSYIINYLKKHYKSWALYNEDLSNDNSKSQNHPKVKIVRTFGKNINLLKFDNSKIMSLSKNTVEADSTKKTEDKPEIISLVEVNQLNKYATEKNDNVNTIIMNENGPKLKPFYKEQNIFSKNTENLNEEIIKSKYFSTEEITDQKTDVSKLMNPIKKSCQNIKKTQNIVEKMDFPNAGHTFMQEAKNAAPKVIRNMKLIDEYEKRIKNREPLDLDLLDYSEIYEPSITENLQADNVCNNSDNSEGAIANNNNNGSNNTKSTLTDFNEDMNLGNQNTFSPILESKNLSFTFKKKLTDIMNTKNPKIHPKNDNYYFYPISRNDNTVNHQKNNETGTDNIATNNDSCIDNDNSEIHNDNSEIHNDISGIRNDHDNLDKIAQVRDDSTNDSGFENDSTYAHSVVKIFLNELSTSFKAIYEFVNKFIVEVRDIQSCELRKNILHNQARKSLEDMAAIIQRLRSIIKRESAEETVLRTLLLKAGVEATTDKRMTRYKQIVMKSLEQARILENALKIIASTTRGDFDFEAVSTNAHSVTSSKVAIKYFNIFEQP